jgi:hypothetical protein
VSHPASRTGARRYAYQGRHRAASGTSTAVRSAALSAGVVAAVMVGAAAPASAAPSGDAWYRLRVCESGNNYRTNTGNGYYGAYQFDLPTWRSVGGTGLPSNASPAEQDYRARLLYQQRGWAPWTCARMLGLSGDPSYGHVAVTPTIRAPASAFGNRVVRVAGTARPGATVEVWQRDVTQTTFRHVRSVRTDGNGRWATAFRFGHTSRYHARADGRRSAMVTTRLLIPTTINGPRAQKLGTSYQISGKARPLSTVVVLFRAAGQHAFAPKRWVRSDRHGRWSAPWRATTDYRYYARGDVPSRRTVTKIRTTATAPATNRLAAGPVWMTVAGTARPAAALVVYLRRAGSIRFVRVARVGVSRTGHYAAAFAASGSFDWFAMSSNGQRSPLRRVTS